MVKNCAAWLVVGGRKYDPVTSVLKQLYWLPIERHIVYKLPCISVICLIKRYIAAHRL